MTALKKKISRRAERPFGHYHKRIVVSLEPGDVISMRLERSRHSARLPIASVYTWMVSIKAEMEAAFKRQRRKAHGYGKEVVP